IPAGSVSVTVIVPLLDNAPTLNTATSSVPLWPGARFVNSAFDVTSHPGPSPAAHTGALDNPATQTVTTATMSAVKMERWDRRVILLPPLLRVLSRPLRPFDTPAMPPDQTPLAQPGLGLGLWFGFHRRCWRREIPHPTERHTRRNREYPRWRWRALTTGTRAYRCGDGRETDRFARYVRRARIVKIDVFIAVLRHELPTR